MHEVTVLKQLTKCNSLQASWNNLADSMAYPSPFVRPDWVLSALEANKKNWSPYFIQVKKTGKRIAILPLYQRKANFVSELRYIGDCYYPDPLGICCEAGKRQACIKSIQEYLFQHNNWDILRLNWLPGDEAEAWGNNDLSICYNGTTEPYLILPESFNVYLQSFKRKKRYNLNASVRKFEKAGGNYCSAKNYTDKRDFLKHLFSIHARRSAERNIESSFAGEELFQFHESLLNKMDTIWLRSLEIDGKIIAVLYGFLHQDRFFYYQIAHDPLFRKQSPGTVLLYKVIEECCNSGVKEFNFLQGDEGYKWQWTKESRRLQNVTIYNRTLAGAVLKQKEKAFSAVKRIAFLFKNNE